MAARGATARGRLEGKGPCLECWLASGRAWLTRRLAAAHDRAPKAIAARIARVRKEGGRRGGGRVVGRVAHLLPALQERRAGVLQPLPQWLASRMSRKVSLYVDLITALVTVIASNPS